MPRIVVARLGRVEYRQGWATLPNEAALLEAYPDWIEFHIPTAKPSNGNFPRACFLKSDRKWAETAREARHRAVM